MLSLNSKSPIPFRPDLVNTCLTPAKTRPILYCSYRRYAPYQMVPYPTYPFNQYTILSDQSPSLKIQIPESPVLG